MITLKPLFTFAALLVALATAHAQTVSLTANPAQLWKVENGALEAAPANVLRWRVNTGQSGALSLANSVLADLKEYDIFNFEWRIVSGGLSQLELYVLGNATGPRRTKVHNWTLGLMTTPKGEWQTENLELARPGWFPWDADDGTATNKFFRLETLALAPDTVIEIRNARLSRAVVRLKPDFIAPISWPTKTTDENGNVTYRTTYQVQNSSGAPTDLEAEVLSKHAKFKVAFEQTKVRVNASDATDFVLTATISAADIAATPELYSEPLRLRFYATGQPAAAWQWDGFLTRPLAPDLKRQVIAAPATLEILREKVKAGDVAALKTLDYAKIIARADELAGVELQQIAGSHSQPRNRLPAAKPGDFMPQIINTATGKREVGTALADQFWKEYLGHGGATEALGLAYLLTGDEKYARKATELFALYGRHYARLDWNSGFEAKWSDGPAILASSRVANSSTYGSNWFFKKPLQLLSMIAESPSWKAADRDAIYRGFALPYATELMKFPAGVNNMTDVTNANVLLLGLVFDDANMVRWALQRDSGLLARLGDLDDDGFSSEGRPLNYHLAAMDEYLTSLVYLENSGLKVDIPKERLLKALRMPFSRATLTGAVPMTGDMGRGYTLRNTKLADEMFALFPDQKWLFEIGGQSNLTAQAHALKTGQSPDKEGWKSLLETQPRLYKNAGFAILREGDTPQSQIMATLDWGRNPVHGAFDRNQFTLSAFGKAFTAGPGSLYNAGKGGATFGDDADLKAFVGYSTLAHNLITVDGQDQLPSVGKLLKWGRFAHASARGFARRKHRARRRAHARRDAD